MGMYSSIEVSASGLSAERLAMDVIANNLANVNTTRTPEGGPYRRKDVVFESDSSVGSFSSAFHSALDGNVEGVKVGETVVDNSEPERRYMPGHPDADKDGYVAYPKINPAEDMVDLLGASRSYGANVAAISAVKDMIQKSIDLFR